MDTMNSPHIQGYCNQIRREWESSEGAKKGAAPEVHLEHRCGWALWIDEPQIVATDGELAIDDCSDVIRCLTGWTEEEIQKFMWKVKEEQKPRVFTPIFDRVE